MAQPLQISCGSKTRDIRNPDDVNLSLNILPGVDTSKYALLIKSVFVVDLAVGSDYDSFDAAAYNNSIDPSNLRKPKGVNSSDFSVIELKNHPSDPSNNPFAASPQPAAESEFIYSDKEISMADFARVVNYALDATNNLSTQGFYGLIIECIPFETTEIRFGKNGEGRITVVGDMVNHFNSNNPFTTAYTNALCNSISMPVPPHPILTSSDFMEKYAGPRTKADAMGFIATSTAYASATVVSHHGGHKIGQQSTVPVFDLTDATSTSIINSHRSYLAERVLFSFENGRGSKRHGDDDLDGFVDAGSEGARFGGYFNIVMNSNRGLLHTSYLHELAHCLAPWKIPSFQDFYPHMAANGATAMLSKLNASGLTDGSLRNSLARLLSTWRGFGLGRNVSFDEQHLSPAHSSDDLHSCPLIYVVNNELLPMPSTSLLAYPTNQVRTAGEIYWGADYLGATCDDIDFPLRGEVFLYEAFVSLVNDFAYDGKPRQDDRVSTDNEAFLMFNANSFENHVSDALGTKSLFLKLQILWGGIKPRGRSFLNSAQRNADVVDFTKIPVNRPRRAKDLEELFFDTKIKGYDHGFKPTQEDEYKLNYQDGEVRIFSDGGSVDFLKRENYIDSRHHHEEYYEGVTHDVHSHVSDTVLDLMEFEVSDTVIEVINGEPRRTFGGIAGYSYIISKARGDTEAELAAAFTLDEADAKIASIFGGVKMAKQMAFTNAQGEEECKYVYVVVRLASSLKFTPVTITDDKGRSIAIS